MLNGVFQHFRIHKSQLKQNFVNQNKTIRMNTFLPTRNKFIYPSTVEIMRFGSDEIL